MPKPPAFLNVELRDLVPLRVLHRNCLFRSASGNPDKVIRPAFKELRLRISAFGLDPDTLLHVGAPEIIDGQLAAYNCCIEFPLPEEVENATTLPGGRYAVLTVEKRPEKIRPAIRAFSGDYFVEQSLILDEERPIYEIYYKETMEYCLPIR